MLLTQAGAAWRRQAEASLQEVGLTHPQFMIMSGLERLTREGQVNQIALARHCMMDVATTSQILCTLERKGLVERRHNSMDHRAKFPCLTEAGRRTVNMATMRVRAAERNFFATLGEQQRLESFAGKLDELLSSSVAA